MTGEGVHLTRTDENVAEIDALARLLGGRVPLGGVLSDLDRQGRRTWAPGRAVHEAFTFDARDRRDPRWWPQGVTTSADASDTGRVEGRRLVVVAWYAKQLPGDPPGRQGARVTLFDLDSRRYRHVLLVVPTMKDGVLGLSPLRVHAGGIVWFGDHLHVAATAKGFMTCRMSDLMRVPDAVAGERGAIGVEGDRVASYGYRYVLPVRFSYRAHAEEDQERLRYSFLSLDRGSSPPALVAGEYATRGRTRRLARFPTDPETTLLETGDDGRSLPSGMEEGVGHMQGAVVARGRYHVTVSRTPYWFGSVFTGSPGRWRERRLATPMGPEDLAYWPETDLLWSVTEHPRRRWIFSMRRSWFD
ncbi:hypothetical protein [Nocardioides sp. cx-173]|uniref:hypothetical protein n=1 Tax=Nocardioides sp. cx-173 TaxID=2898796 RepID=UPI001E50EDEC|nr:hypothetical protein [Nocardioides sp. cx-173]MCD4525580.1 hypothetical protein [Nocardioides sp. cx-173]UGB42724.1 hypothetical protein LQ940_04155 [Nocardioides sp. cx-173]